VGRTMFAPRFLQLRTRVAQEGFSEYTVIMGGTPLFTRKHRSIIGGAYVRRDDILQ